MSDDLVTIETPSAVAPLNLFGTTDPKAAMAKAAAYAKLLTKVVKEQGLSKAFRPGAKPHVFVDGWTFLGSLLGLFPYVVWTRRIMEGDECIGWEARVEARTLQGQPVSAGEAQCLYAEANWKNKEEYALRSMAQTRATGKTMRLPLSFIMVLAGYAPTPAEEMQDEDLEPKLRASIEAAKAKKAGGGKRGSSGAAENQSGNAPPAIQSATGLTTEEHLAEAARKREEALALYGPGDKDDRPFEEQLADIEAARRVREGRPISVPDHCVCGTQIDRYEHVDGKTGEISNYWECATRHENRRILAGNGKNKLEIRKDDTVTPHFIKWMLK